MLPPLTSRSYQYLDARACRPGREGCHEAQLCSSRDGSRLCGSGHNWTRQRWSRSRTLPTAWQSAWRVAMCRSGRLRRHQLHVTQTHPWCCHPPMSNRRGCCMPEVICPATTCQQLPQAPHSEQSRDHRQMSGIPACYGRLQCRRDILALCAVWHGETWSLVIGSWLLAVTITLSGRMTSERAEVDSS